MNNRLLKFLGCGLALFLYSVEPLLAQQQGITEVYTVAYVEAIPSSRDDMLKVLREYRTRSQAGKGCLYVNLYEQEGWPGHFVVIEWWTDEDALSAHAMSSVAREFQDELMPLRASGYDQRPYVPLSQSPDIASSPGNDGERIVISHVDIGPGGQMDTNALLTDLAVQSRSEPGNISFDVLRHRQRGNHFTVIGRWRNQAALDAHVAAAHTRQYRDTVQPVTGSPLDERLFKAL